MWEDIKYLVLSLAGTYALIFVLFCIREWGREWLQKQRALCSHGWTYNAGVQPPLFNVDIVFMDGKAKWSVKAKELEWSKLATRPIRKFRRTIFLE